MVKDLEPSPSSWVQRYLVASRWRREYPNTAVHFAMLRALTREARNDIAFYDRTHPE